CGSDSCTGEIETTLAGGSDTWIAANVAGSRRLFLGGDGVGLDDLLQDLGHGDVADDLSTALDAAEAAATALDLPIDVAVTEDPEAARALYDALKGATDLLKGDLATLLALQIPNEAAGDND